MARAQIATGLDVGTSSIKILTILSKDSQSSPEVVFQGSFPSAGLRKGVVVDKEETSKKISEAISQAQAESGQKINSVYLNIGGSHISSFSSHGVVIVSRADQMIGSEDVERVLGAAQAISLPPNKEILDVFPKEFIIDGEGGIKEPLGMHGVRLETEALVLLSFSPFIKNLTTAVLNANLQINDLEPSPIAAAIATLSKRAKELGVAVLDIGAGTSGLAVFEEGNLIHLAIFPVGSDLITNDIAIGLRIDIDFAEKIKRQFGSCLLSKANRRKKIKIDNGPSPLVFSQKMLTEIIEARVSEIFELVQKELKKISRQELLPAGVVLTGGGAKLPNIVELAKRELKLPCRIGLPNGIIGIEKEPSLATVAGLVLEGIETGERKSDFFPRKGIISKVKKIFKNFIP